MKKIARLMLILVVAMGVAFTGCAKSDGVEKSNSSGENNNEKLKVGFLYVGPVGDGGYTYAHDQGRLYLQEKLGDKVDATIIKESVKEDDAEVLQVCEEMINNGVKVIFGTSYGFMNGMKKAAENHPDVKFLHCSGYEMAENMSNYFGRDYQVRYLSGIVAGMKTKANKIGYVAAFPIPECVRGINAFTLGVRSVNPDAVVKVTWTNTWYDPVKEKEAAKALLDDGVDIIAQHQDTTGPQQAAEEKGVWSIGYNSDMSAAAPNAYMTAPIWNWGPYYVDQVQKILDGTWKAESYWGAIDADDSKSIIYLAPLTKNAPEGAQEAVDKAKADIISGKNKVFVGPLKDNTGALKVAEGVEMTDEEMLSFDWFVEGVEGKVN
ncbi:BMP family ABC transporter substrate-binding protein [Clostridium thermarum]|uniref:BMP family ABC transporter substrate-binding protein n=1 Tax=Clostridium thermarum TaxID=1716543 RepID=UPI00111E1077|nr:BMP family ABC transporter substrate-binding protein [Clostridium thermarum]